MKRVEDMISPPDVPAKGSLGGWRDTRLPDFLVAILFVGDGIAAPGLGIPFAQVGLIPLCLIALTRKPTVSLGKYKWVVVVLVVLVGYLSLVSGTALASAGASSWTRRLIRLVAVMLATYLIAVGRIHLPSVLRGLLVGLIGNAALFYLHLAPDNYEGALSGFLGDKNKSGMYYSVVGMLLLIEFKKWSSRLVFIGVFGALMWLTESRTSMTAFAAGMIFALVLARAPWVIRWLGAYGLWQAVTYLEANLAHAGAFENRWGSDLLRARIDAAAQLKVAAAPWFGSGLGEAYVVIREQQWFFHNSYDTLRVEGGWPYLVAVVLITVVVGLRPFSRGESAWPRVITAGATVTLLICAWKLGEVFITIPWALLVGASLNSLVTGDAPDEASPPGATPVEEPLLRGSRWAH